jgi:small subunit ribosomal protein S3
MGQKVNPIKFRIGAKKADWQSRWFANKDEYRKLLLEDIRLREALKEKLKIAGVETIEIERLPKAMTVKFRVSRPGVVIGRGGSGIEEIKKFIMDTVGIKEGDQATKIDVVVEEVKNPELSAFLVAQRIASELERRLPTRRVVTKALERVMAAGAKGVKIVLSGRIDGAEISRREKYALGSVPTQSLRADIDYAHVPALLRSGYVGVKVWINKGEKNAT